MTTEQKLREARKAYYEDGTSPLTDAEFDVLEDELRAVDPDNTILKEVDMTFKKAIELAKSTKVL